VRYLWAPFGGTWREGLDKNRSRVVAYRLIRITIDLSLFITIGHFLVFLFAHSIRGAELGPNLLASIQRNGPPVGIAALAGWLALHVWRFTRVPYLAFVPALLCVFAALLTYTPFAAALH
jgi:hypothetical protein